MSQSDTPILERVARAIEGAQIGYSIRLVRLVNGVATHELTYDGLQGAPLEFASHLEASEYVTARKREIQAKAALEAMGHDDLVAALREARHILEDFSEATRFDEDCDGDPDTVGYCCDGACREFGCMKWKVENTKAQIAKIDAVLAKVQQS